MIQVTFWCPSDDHVVESWPDWTSEDRIKEHARMLGALCYTYAEVQYVDDSLPRVSPDRPMCVDAVRGGGPK